MLKNNHEKGFTIVELLIVIVVIAILAAITIVAYNGIQERTKTSLVENDLRSASTKLETYRVDNGTYPASLSDLSGYKPSSGVSVQYTQSSDTEYCMTANAGAIVRHIDQGGTIQTGACSGHSDTGPVSVSTYATASGISNGGEMIMSPTGRLFGLNDNLAGYIYEVHADNTVTTFSPASTSSDNSYFDTTYSVGGLAYAPDGTMYLVGNRSSYQPISELFKVASDGTRTRLAPGVTYEYARGLAVSSSGYAYIAQTTCIKKVALTNPSAPTLVAGDCDNGGSVTDGTGAAARFYNLGSIQFGPDGALYATDYGSVRKIDVSSGAVTTVASSASAGFLNGLVVKSNGQILAATGGSTKVLTVQGGSFVTYAGSDSSGHVDGDLSDARFSSVTTMTLGTDGAVYVLDAGTIRKIQ